jgi:hypothetical protein
MHATWTRNCQLRCAISWSGHVSRHDELAAPEGRCPGPSWRWSVPRASWNLGPMNGPVSKVARCAIDTRKSTEHNLDLSFNSLDAQRKACEAYIKSQAPEGWRLIPDHYDDGAFSGASLERPAQVLPSRRCNCFFSS